MTYTAPEGFHDDAVCALALAVAHYAAKIVRHVELKLQGALIERPSLDELTHKAEQDVLAAIAADGVYWPGR